jgi:branched-subunit amino acid transport protein
VTEPVTGIALALVIVGLALSTLLTRTSFLLAGQRLRLGHHIEVALRYAPVCTLAAIIVPNVFLHEPNGVFDFSLLNPRLYGVLAAGLWLCWSRNIVGCLVTGMLGYSLARLFF